MGQKVNPISFRIGVNNTWDSKWSHDINYSRYLVQDISIRSFIEDLCSYQGLFTGKLAIWRTSSLKGLNIGFRTREISYPDILIYFQIYVPYKIHSSHTSVNQKQEWLFNFENTIQNHLEDQYSMLNVGVIVDPIFEESTLKHVSNTTDTETVINNDLLKWLLNKDCLLIAQWIASSFQKRKGLKELCKSIDKCFEYIQEENKDSKYLLNGIKVTCSGRFKLTDNEKRRNKMARVKTYKRGQIPLQTLCKHVNYSVTTAYTPDGTSGIKVWISYEPRTNK